jgi:hypothetical protein
VQIVLSRMARDVVELYTFRVQHRLVGRRSLKGGDVLFHSPKYTSGVGCI